MRRYVADANCEAAVDLLDAVIAADELLLDVASAAQIVRVDFAAIGLSRDAADDEVRAACNLQDVVLLTSDIAMKTEDALESVLRRETDAELPVVTFRHERVETDADLRRRVAYDLVEVLLDIETLRGTRRVWLPRTSV